MARAIKYALLILLFPAAALAGPVGTEWGVKFGSEGHVHVVAAAGVNYEEDFETDGAPNGNWSADDPPNIDYDWASGTTMEGSECLKIGNTRVAYYDPNYNASDLYITFWFWFDEVIEGDETILISYNDSGQGYHYLKLTATEKLLVESLTGGTVDIGTTVLSPNTVYKIKVRLQEGSGADLQIDAWLWDGSSWTDQITCNDGDRTGKIDKVAIQNSADTETFVFDMFKDDTSDIASPD